MACVIMDVCGLKGECVTSLCVYWRCFGEGDTVRPECALTHFGLVGVEQDRLTRWLLEFKLKAGLRVRLDQPCFTESYAESARARASA